MAQKQARSLRYRGAVKDPLVDQPRGLNEHGALAALGDSLTDHRDKALLSLAYVTGLRAGELVPVHVEDVAEAIDADARLLCIGLTLDLFATGEDAGPIVQALHWTSTSTALRYGRKLAPSSNATARMLRQVRSLRFWRGNPLPPILAELARNRGGQCPKLRQPTQGLRAGRAPAAGHRAVPAPRRGPQMSMRSSPRASLAARVSCAARARGGASPADPRQEVLPFGGVPRAGEL
ncbi:site-specific integrase [Novosphingobium sp. KN65.2]|uniref:site-specific integrase n=1 Tax=Novosphingobium sp. KN65.2 TaxID=1478134 RepID=UPI0005DADC04|nr:site-specific integrase [Novosphingobium sp. KN65.2]CDO38609.1 hypothetical protein SPHV1_640015 [Novosphingobium sp. KN65.2]